MAVFPRGAASLPSSIEPTPQNTHPSGAGLPLRIRNVAVTERCVGVSAAACPERGMTSIFYGGESIPKALRRHLHVACEVLLVLGCSYPSSETRIQCINKDCKKERKKTRICFFLAFYQDDKNVILAHQTPRNDLTVCATLSLSYSTH